jgi:hypothetical protein
MAALGGGGGGSWFDVSAEVDVDPNSAKVGGSPVYVKNSPPEQDPVRTARAIAARMTRPATFMAAPVLVSVVTDSCASPAWGDGLPGPHAGLLRRRRSAARAEDIEHVTAALVLTM